MSETGLLIPMEAGNAASVPANEKLNGSNGTVGGIKRSGSLKALVGALAKAQLEFSAVRKDAENPAYTRGTRKSMYATLDSVISATRPALAKYGLVIISLPQEMVDDRRLKITSILIHDSDEFIESTLTMTAVEKVTPQELGKLITYARRYQWTSLAGVAPEDDTDGNEASGVGSREAAQAVGDAKVADLKAKAQKPGKLTETPKALFFTYPERHNGNYAEFVNLAAFGASLDEVAQEGLRQVFAKFASKITKENTALVPQDRMATLLAALAGDCGLTVQQLQAAQ